MPDKISRAALKWALGSISPLTKMEPLPFTNAEYSCCLFYYYNGLCFTSNVFYRGSRVLQTANASIATQPKLFTLMRSNKVLALPERASG